MFDSHDSTLWVSQCGRESVSCNGRPDQPPAVGVHGCGKLQSEGIMSIIQIMISSVLLKNSTNFDFTSTNFDFTIFTSAIGNLKISQHDISKPRLHRHRLRFTRGGPVRTYPAGEASVSVAKSNSHKSRRTSMYEVCGWSIESGNASGWSNEAMGHVRGEPGAAC
jgi:hypothetical protein